MKAVRCWSYLGVRYACYVRRRDTGNIQCLFHKPDCVLLRTHECLQLLQALKGNSLRSLGRQMYLDKN